ncbi:MAG: hypothetical protein ACOCWA_07975 [Bacteroidota bacterium]
MKTHKFAGDLRELDVPIMPVSHTNNELGCSAGMGQQENHLRNKVTGSKKKGPDKFRSI